MNGSNRCTARGFTLIELLVVVVIVGVLVAAVTLSAGGSGARTLENAAQRSRALITLACERALLGGHDIGFAPLQGGLHFGYFEAEGWRLIQAETDELRARPWGDGVEVRAQREREESIELPVDAPGEPPFACLSSGELTPLTWEFRRADVRETWRLEGRLDGQITLTAVSDAR